MPRDRASAPLPSKDELRRFLVAQDGRPPMHELLRVFGVPSGERAGLRRLLRELDEEGAVPAARRRIAPKRSPASPTVTVATVTAIDEEGDLRCRAEALPDARILLPALSLPGRAPGVGDRVLVRLRRAGRQHYDAELMKILPGVPREAVGVVEAADDGLRLRPLERQAKLEYRLAPDDAAGAAAGDLVRAEVTSRHPLALPRARVIERLGRADDPAAVSLSAAVRAGLPIRFSPEALAEAAAVQPVALGQRQDLRDLDLVTIDGEDARDFDDAVWAEPDEDSANPGGFRLVVAIADVAHYVRTGSALDREAYERGNSVYFPDRAIPMLPEALSNDLCSLRPLEDCACLAASMRIDREGRLLDARFVRGLMRSRARLTYTQVQRARDGAPDEATGPLVDSVIAPLYAAFDVLAAARRRRGTIELDLPERRVVLDEVGRIAGVSRRERLASHMLIEEFMILANVAAATLLEEAGQPGLFRVHDKPDPAKLAVLADYLERIGIPWSRTAKRPGDFTALLERLTDHNLKEALASFVLRAQAQAVYSPRNIGHFGLNLRRYTHFTSPIRRYSDLVVHRMIIGRLGLGQDGVAAPLEPDQLEELGRHLSRTERRAMEVERAALERFVALHLASRVGALFAGKVTGVQHFGLFVTLDETGADGLVPVSTLDDDIYAFDERHHAIVGQRWGESFGLGDTVGVELTEVDAVTGSLVFRLDTHERAHGAELARAAWSRTPGRRGRGRATRPRR